MTTTVQEFISGKLPVISIRLGDSLKDAVKLMLRHDYSQLPVVDSENSLVGFVTSDSILNALNNYGMGLDGLLMKHVLTKKPQTFRQDIDLLDLFDEMNGPFACIVDEEGRLVQILTTFDVADYFRQRARDIILVENIESFIRDYVQLIFASKVNGETRLSDAIQSVSKSNLASQENFTKAVRHYLGKTQQTGGNQIDEDVLNRAYSSNLGLREGFTKAVSFYLGETQPNGNDQLNEVVLQEVFEKHLGNRQSPTTFDELTLGDYISLFLDNDTWPYLKELLGLEKPAITNLLNSVRLTRNDLSHFREIGADQSRQLRDCYNLLVEHEEAIRTVFPTYSPSPLETVPSIAEKPEPGAGTVNPTADEPQPGESRYAALAIWLQGQPLEKSVVASSFDEIEAIIGGELPESAYKHRAWWANDSVGHVQSKVWLDVGWRVAGINMTDKLVRFSRIEGRQGEYIHFFNVLDELLRKLPGFEHLDSSPDGPNSHLNLSPGGSNWHSVKGISGGGQNLAVLNFAFGRTGTFRVELYIDSGEGSINKRLFDALHAEKDDIEQEIGHELNWQRLDNNRASKVSRVFEGRITDSDEELKELAEKASTAMVVMLKVFEPRVRDIGKRLLSSTGEPNTGAPN